MDLYWFTTLDNQKVLCRLDSRSKVPSQRMVSSFLRLANKLTIKMVAGEVTKSYGIEKVTATLRSVQTMDMTTQQVKNTIVQTLVLRDQSKLCRQAKKRPGQPRETMHTQEQGMLGTGVMVGQTRKKGLLKVLRTRLERVEWVKEQVTAMKTMIREVRKTKLKTQIFKDLNLKTLMVVTSMHVKITSVRIQLPPENHQPPTTAPPASNPITSITLTLILSHWHCRLRYLLRLQRASVRQSMMEKSPQAREQARTKQEMAFLESCILERRKKLMVARARAKKRTENMPISYSRLFQDLARENREVMVMTIPAQITSTSSPTSQEFLTRLLSQIRLYTNTLSCSTLPPTVRFTSSSIVSKNLKYVTSLQLLRIAKEQLGSSVEPRQVLALRVGLRNPQRVETLT